MRQTKRTPTPPTAEERDGLARTYSYAINGSIVSLSRSAVKELTIHRRDAVSASRRERRRMSAILRDDKLQARINKAIQRQLDKVEKRSPPHRIRVSVKPENRRRYQRKEHKITPRSVTPLPSYDAPIIDRQGRRSIVMVVDYDGAKRHSFGIFGRRVIYLANTEHCELDQFGRPIFMSNMGANLEEVLMAAGLSELAQRESRKDAKVNVNLIIQLPHDVPQEVRAQILKAVSHELFGRHGLPYAASLHRPDPGGDERNYHGHICGSWRPMTRAAPYGWDIAEDYRSDLDGPAYWRHARRRVAEIMTAALEREGTVRHYTHLSNAERGLAHKPQKKLDKRKTRAAREGEFVADNEANRRLIEANVALDKRLKEKRQAQRRRSFNRKLAALAQVELASFRSLDLRPVLSHDTAASSAPKVAFVPPFRKSAATSLHPVGEGRNSAAPAAALSAVEAPPSNVNIRLRSVTPTTWNGQVAKVEPVTGASITPGLRTVSHGTQNTAWTTLLRPVAVPEKGAANLRAVAKPTRTEGLGLLAPIRRRLINPEAEFALKPVEIILRKPPQWRPVDAKPRLPILGLKPIAKIPNPWPRIMKVTGSITSSISTLRPVAGAPAAAHVPLSAILRRVDPPSSSRLTQTSLRPVSLVSHRPEIRAVDPPRRTISPNIRPVSSPAREWRLSERIARIERTAIEPLSQLRRVDRADASGLDARLVQTMQAFAERLAAIARKRDAIRDQVRPENIDASASENRAAETKPAEALATNLRAFADAMRRKPTGLTLSEDGIVLPVSALASSWGVSREALASNAAKRLLMPLYVEQELRFERLEIELKFAGIGERELADPERKFANGLSADAAKTLEIYSRSQLLHDALHRVYREISLGENVRSRTREMKARGIDWRAFAAQAEDRKRLLRLAQQQSISRQNGLE